MPNREEVVRGAQRALAEVLKETARRCCGVVLEEAGLLLVAGNHSCPVFVNSALRTGTIDAGEALSRTEAFFGKRGHGYEMWIRDVAEADLESAALSVGMRLAAELSGMVLHGSPEAPQTQPRY